MPEFEYVATDVTGKKVEGKMDVANEGELRMQLRNLGLRPVRIQRPSWFELGEWFSSVPGNQPQQMFSHLNHLARCGIGLSECLDLLSQEESSQLFRSILFKTSERLRGGKTFSECLAIYPRIFDKAVLGIIEAGEINGRMDEAISRASEYLKRTGELRFRFFQVVSQTGYLITLLLAGLFLWINRLWLKESLLNEKGMLAVGIVLLMFWLSRVYVQTIPGRAIIERLWFRLPLVGRFVLNEQIAKVSIAMKVLLDSGYALPAALEKAKSATEIILLEYAFREMRIQIDQGVPLSQTMVKHKVIPKLAVHMVGTGERAGSLPQVFTHMANFFESEALQGVRLLKFWVNTGFWVCAGMLLGVLL